MGDYGKLIISYTGGPTIDFGVVTSVNPQYTKSVSTTPIVSLPIDSAFAIESSSVMAYSFEFARKNGTDGVTNAKWYDDLTSAMDRWQARTNGFRLQFIPEDNPNMMALDINVFYRTCTRQYKQGDVEMIYGSINFTQGTMYLLSSPSGEYIPKSEFEIAMTESTGTRWFVVMSEKLGVDCVTEYTLRGGMEQPFEYMTLTIPKTRLTSVASALVDNIKPGMSRLMLNAVGRSAMIVSSCKLSGENYTVTAYCEAEQLRGYALESASAMTPFEWIVHILTSGMYGVDFKEGKTFLYHVNPPSDPSDILEFDSGANVWRILQICAIYMKAKVFFTDGKAYLVDYTSTSASMTVDGAKYSRQATELFPVSDQTEYMYRKVTGKASLGNEGKYPTLNQAVITCKGSKDDGWEQSSFTYLDEPSYRYYGVYYSQSFSVPELKQGGGFNQARKFAEGLFAYRRESVQSVEFTTREMYRPKGGVTSWCPTFQTSLTIRSLSSSTDDFQVDNISDIDGRRVPQKLMLSTYERNYPECTTKYKFGMVSAVDLSTSTSQIRTALK